MGRKKKTERIVIYTAIFGKSDDLHEPLLPVRDCVDMVCFTDQPFSSDRWDVRKKDCSQLGEYVTAKSYKFLPHKLFPEYDISVWVDGSILLKRDPTIDIYKIADKSSFALKTHRCRKTVAEEVAHCIERYVGDARKLRAQISAYKSTGMPETAQLMQLGMMVRRHKQEDVIAFNEAMLSEVKLFSLRDQVAFPFLAWKMGLAYRPLSSAETDWMAVLSHSSRRS